MTFFLNDKRVTSHAYEFEFQAAGGSINAKVDFKIFNCFAEELIPVKNSPYERKFSKYLSLSECKRRNDPACWHKDCCVPDGEQMSCYEGYSPICNSGRAKADGGCEDQCAYRCVPDSCLSPGVPTYSALYVKGQAD